VPLEEGRRGESELADREGYRNGQARLDKWFPTIVRYVGVALMVYAALVDRGANPALIPTALGMILFKTVYGSGPPAKESE
jgi:hypothetical protein